MKRAVAFTCLSVAMFSAASANEEIHLTTKKTAHTYIAQFRAGTEFHIADSVSALIRDGEIDSLSLSVLSKELKNGNRDVRENIIRLLETVALALESNSPSKFRIIRDRAIIKTLLTDGFAKEDSARQLAELILLKKCRPADLAVFNDIYVAEFKAGNSSYLQIAAKAKTAAAKPYVDKLAKHRFWSDDPENRELINIAQAALGNERLERKYINAVYEADKAAPPAPQNTLYDVGDARDGREVAKNLATLGRIGTRQSLLVACKYLRSPLKSFAGAGERSVRYSALDAIRYNYPDERLLDTPMSTQEWRAAEQFCTNHIGAVFDGPTPDLPPDVIIPMFAD